MATCTASYVINNPLVATNIMSCGYQGEQQQHLEDDIIIATVHLSQEMSVRDIHDVFVHDMTYPADPEVRDPITVSKVDCAASQPLQYSYCDDHKDLATRATSSSPIIEETKSRPLPAFASVSVLKESEDTRLGMGIKKANDGTFIVSSMKPGCLLSDTPIEVGDTLVSMNNRSCAHKTGAAVASLLKNTVGWLTVTVEHPNGDPMLVESMIRKETPTSKTGLGVATHTHNRVKISSVNSTSPFAPSLLGPRDSIVSVNGHSCQYMSAQQVAKIIGEAHDTVTVAAQKDLYNAAIVTF